MEQGAGSEPVQRHDAFAMRISDEDRHRVAEVLRHAAGEGRIDLDELDQRLEATYAAKTYGELVPITADLPVAGQRPAQPVAPRPVSSPPVPAAEHVSSVSIMSDVKRVGVWQPGETHAAFTMMGGITLDLREAVFTHRELVVNASAIMGEVKVIVNAHTAVVVEGVGIMGEYSESRPRVPAALDEHSPVVRVKGMALMGSVHVQRKGPPGETVRKKLGWHA